MENGVGSQQQQPQPHQAPGRRRRVRVPPEPTVEGDPNVLEPIVFCKPPKTGVNLARQTGRECFFTPNPYGSFLKYVGGDPNATEASAKETTYRRKEYNREDVVAFVDSLLKNSFKPLSISTNPSESRPLATSSGSASPPPQRVSSRALGGFSEYSEDRGVVDASLKTLDRWCPTTAFEGQSARDVHYGFYLKRENNTRHATWLDPNAEVMAPHQPTAFLSTHKGLEDLDIRELLVSADAQSRRTHLLLNRLRVRTRRSPKKDPSASQKRTELRTLMNSGSRKLGKWFLD